MLRFVLLVLLAVAWVGCAHDIIAMHVTTEPPASRVFYRVVDSADQTRPRTGWVDLGPAPIVREVSMHPAWSHPGSLLEVKAEHPGYTPETRIFNPAAILTSGRHLQAHILIAAAPPPGPAPEGGPPPAGGPPGGASAPPPAANR